uniref:Uncharacterized protein n=1 Tax=Chromera velia CCMP2878 TaxID=1169474 RepID=A0A0G4HQD3_9ALVE|mmetsp:Transcript_7869/g.15339  ORF Transcript_7869/g.15339 Transcript_7869/m.15339 type:complete len:299 (+) Transcript_7869:114-1010(+)|eukprot:Cvel_7906.t1-p1 / transcript=Cvel_7906.t1 / gene=Cvel_7906 / organism=Chromera_velia_CCMP2878 / gene_product=hypothetical protein / transcript_product=hypothetical protein / location=Cvel_scaffold424:1196-2089(+) / protein_length=298 / sequence_SO=supercontig / SO=protein_coding / is_pseudo=false
MSPSLSRWLVSPLCLLSPLRVTSFSLSTQGPASRLFSSTSGETLATIDETPPLHQLVKGVAEQPFSSSVVPEGKVFRHRYVGLRHGQSKANVEGIISSEPSIGCVRHGLTEMGREQARSSASSLKDLLSESELKSAEFISSDFTRARETAVECMGELSRLLSPQWIPPPLRIDQGLRERFFGDLDGLPLSKYHIVWPIDSLDARNARHRVESVNATADRVGRLLCALEREGEPGVRKTFVLVSHADTLQIMQSFLVWAETKGAGWDPRLFHQLRFANAEVRDLRCLPDPVPIEYPGPA